MLEYWNDDILLKTQYSRFPKALLFAKPLAMIAHTIASAAAKGIFLPTKCRIIGDWASKTATPLQFAPGG
jgi:hypothetical protein